MTVSGIFFFVKCRHSPVPLHARLIVRVAQVWQLATPEKIIDSRQQVCERTWYIEESLSRSVFGQYYNYVCTFVVTSPAEENNMKQYRWVLPQPATLPNV